MNFIPYGKQTINQDDVDTVVDTLKSDYLTTGPKVKEFEDSLSSYCGAKYVLAVANGTAALHLASLVLFSSSSFVLTICSLIGLLTKIKDKTMSMYVSI